MNRAVFVVLLDGIWVQYRGVSVLIGPCSSPERSGPNLGAHGLKISHIVVEKAFGTFAHKSEDRFTLLRGEGE